VDISEIEIMAITQKITATLWFDMQAEEAVNYYCSIFKNSRILRTAYYGKEGHEITNMPDGAVLTIEFELDGVRFVALNGGPVFKFNEAVSFVVNCKDQEEVDYYWEKLTAGGDEKAQQCGWLKDRYGVSWQVTPTILPDMMNDKDKEKRERVMKVMLQMKKINIKALEEAYNGG
jgi:predicted 3-demethylubiquinone-9 3-methyltransferase (glyoxalase superfamily)